MLSEKKPLVAISLGDPSGIGPEVTAKALSKSSVKQALIPIVFGDEAIWTEACRASGVDDRLERISFELLEKNSGVDKPSLVPVTDLAPDDRILGKPSALGGKAQLAFFERAMDALRLESVEAICTAPLSKSQVCRAGISFSGHTEHLAERFKSRVLMMLAGPVLRVAVHTTHISISDVPSRLSTAGIVTDLELMDRELRAGFAIEKPRIAVCALNPHAGEHGIFGDEEAKIIEPAIERAKTLGIDVTGPHPADGLFPHASKGAYDAILAMYHDQGLIPLKLLHFDEGVNVTLGLPKPRTSPDHGVAYDLAGQGLARPQSMESALLLAARLAIGRRRAAGAS